MYLTSFTDEEVKAVQILSQAIRDSPQSFTLLHVQCDFLRSKGKYEWAVRLAQQAVNCAPSEFVTWAKLTEVYIELGQYESALLTLNSCPMFTYNDRDLHRMPTPSRTHLPIKVFISDSQILEGDGLEEDTDAALARLPAPALRGTFAKAYELLCSLVSAIGWDELLKTRSVVFVMEEEYRNQKAQAAAEIMEDGEGHVNGVEHEHEDASIRDSLATAVDGKAADDDVDDNASTKGMVSPSRKSTSTEPEGGSANTQPRTSTDEPKEPVSAQAEGAAPNGVKKSGFAHGSGGVNKPGKAAASEIDETEDEYRKNHIKADATALNSKRLCERWLDNMFMCLYEVGHRFTVLEWQTYGSRICECGRFSVPKWRISRRIVRRIVRLEPNGRFWETWAHGFCTRRKPKKHTSGVWISNSLQKHGCVCWKFTRMKETCRGV